ncbi:MULTISPECIES: transporter substrate-binding domain-containing protein [unclassified Caballeronia]|uniref:transporter substrate-binding domain-containing protein n=1 Tax=unclassified Caballeronia TaxID=2646786 RepID=UPI002027E1AA|nr:MULTISPECIES: transporter substrate-binding domain-containing protein [unclassified Caballeronia]
MKDQPLVETASVLREIRRRGHLLAGVSKGIIGLSSRDPQTGHWQGFDVELARAIAVAVLGDASAIEFFPIAPDQRCVAVASGQVDVGTFNASATLGRELEHGVIFPKAMLYDGEALMVKAVDMVGLDARQGVRVLANRIVAVQRGATTQVNLERYFGARELAYVQRSYATPAEALQAYAEGECTLYALDRIPLTGERLRLPDPDAHVILDDHISKEAMGPVIRYGDPAWQRAIAWIMRVLIEAEELGINAGNCDDLAKKGPAHVREFLNASEDKSKTLGLQPRFALRIVQQVGNYADIFAAHLGHASPLKLPRLKNDLWSRGGLLISPEFH